MRQQNYDDDRPTLGVWRRRWIRCRMWLRAHESSLWLLIAAVLLVSFVLFFAAVFTR